MYRRNSSIVTAACLVSLLVVIIFLNFRVTTSVAETNFYTRAGDETAIKVSHLPLRQAQTAVVVIGSGIIADSVRSELAQLISENQRGNNQLVLLDESAPESGLPVVEIELVPHGIVWTPIASFSNIEWRVRYAENGNMDAAMKLQSINPAKSVVGSLWLRESSLGIMTWRGYRGYIGQIAARQIDQLLAHHLAGKSLAQLSFQSQ